MLLLVLLKLVSMRTVGKHDPNMFSLLFPLVLFSGVLVGGVFVLNIESSREHVHAAYNSARSTGA